MLISQFLPLFFLRDLQRFEKAKNWGKKGPTERWRRMNLINSSLLFAAKRLRAAEPLCCRLRELKKKKKAKTDRQGKHVR